MGAVGPDQPPFGAQLRRYRARAGLTQEELGARVGLAATTIGALERGVRRRPYPHTRRALAEALGLSAAEAATFVAQQPTANAATGAAPPATRGNLPAPRAPLIGRAREVAALRALVLDEGVRLVTLTGVGGCGKTSLALAAAAELRDACPGGAWLVELAPVADPALVPQALAAALGVQEAAGAPPLDAALARLRERPTLVVLDNCEHLVDACAALAARLLAACPNLRLLATSREPLQLAGERQWRVPPLAAPDPEGDAVPPAQLAGYPAVELFLARAQAVAPAFGLTDENAAAVAGICARLDGLPLAVELAAARVRVLAPAQILARLDDALALLAGGDRAAPTRQQTLRAALDWSYALLTRPERAAFARLAVFAGSFDLEAAEAVCAEVGNEKSEVRSASLSGDFSFLASHFSLLDTLTRLVDKSLVQVDAGGAAARYRLLEPVRQYAAERLAAGGEEAATRCRHAAHYLALAEEAAPRLIGPDQAAWLARLDDERDNLRSALGGALAAGAATTALRFGAALWRFWAMRGHLEEGRRWLAAILGAPADDDSAAARREALFGAGLLAVKQADYPDARRRLAALLPLARAAGGHEFTAGVLTQLGHVARVEGRPAEADARYAESLALRRAVVNRWGMAISLNGLGDVALARGDHARARACYEESLALVRREGDWHQLAEVLYRLGRVHVAQGDLAAAQALYDESLALLRSLGADDGIGLALLNLGDLARARGDAREALARYGESLAHLRAAGARVSIARCLEGIGAVLVGQGRAAEAARSLGAAAGQRAATGVPLPPPSREVHERAVAAARAALGDDVFAAAWAAGGALPPEQAIAEAAALAASTSSPSAAPPAATPLTPREAEVAGLLARGLTDREIAAALAISARTVGVHVQHLIAKLAVHSRWQVAEWAAARDTVERPTD